MSEFVTSLFSCIVFSTPKECEDYLIGLVVNGNHQRYWCYIQQLINGRWVIIGGLQQVKSHSFNIYYAKVNNEQE